MANIKNLVLCTCCNAELTMPQFYNGGAYGWTCITKVCPTLKKIKDVWLSCEDVSISYPSPKVAMANIKIVVMGVTLNLKDMRAGVKDVDGGLVVDDTQFANKNGSNIKKLEDGSFIVKVTRLVGTKKEGLYPKLDISHLIKKRK